LKRIFMSFSLFLVLFLGVFMNAPQQASASLSSCTYVNRNPYQYGSNVDGYNRLNCQTYSDRQSEYCLVFYRNGTTLWKCFVSGEYWGYSFDATAAQYTCYSPSSSVQYWFWDHDYISGETWSGYGPSQYLGRWPC